MLDLHPHPDFPSAVTSLTVTVARPFETGLNLSYRITGAVDAIRWPAPANPGFRDGLWQHTCFEAFLGTASSPAYTELNLSPSHQFAAYQFDGYRSGMRRADGPAIGFTASEDGDACVTWTWQVRLPLLAAGDDWLLGLSAVVEELDGAKSYWALAHAPGPPDFHNRDCFTARLPAPEQP